MTRKELTAILEAKTKNQIFNVLFESRPDCTPVLGWPLDTYRDFIATGKYPYLSDVAAYMAERLRVSGIDALDKLETIAYYCSDQYRKEQWRQFRRDREAEGWTLLDMDNARRLGESNATIRAIVSKTTDWLTQNGELTLRARSVPHQNGARTFFLPPRKRNRGYYADQFTIPGTSDYLFFKELTA